MSFLNWYVPATCNCQRLKGNDRAIYLLTRNLTKTEIQLEKEQVNLFCLIKIKCKSINNSKVKGVKSVDQVILTCCAQNFMCLQKHPYATLLLLCQVIFILYNQKMELMEIVFIIMQKPFSLASSLDQLQYVSVHCIFNHFIGFYYLGNYIYYLIQEELQANRI